MRREFSKLRRQCKTKAQKVAFNRMIKAFSSIDWTDGQCLETLLKFEDLPTHRKALKLMIDWYKKNSKAGAPLKPGNSTGAELNWDSEVHEALGEPFASSYFNDKGEAKDYDDAFFEVSLYDWNGTEVMSVTVTEASSYTEHFFPKDKKSEVEKIAK